MDTCGFCEVALSYVYRCVAVCVHASVCVGRWGGRRGEEKTVVNPDQTKP